MLGCLWNFKKQSFSHFLQKCLDKEIFKNIWSISNLAFVTKVIEWVVASHIKEHMDANMLHEILQSAKKSMHSVKTTLLKVQDDMLQQ